MHGMGWKAAQRWQRINKLDGDTIQSKEEKKVKQKSELSLKSLWDNTKRFDISVIGISGEDKETEVGNILEN